MNHTLVEAAGWTMLNFLWQGALIGALFGLSCAFLRSRPQLQYLAGCLALMTMLIVVTTTFVSQLKITSNEASVAGVAEKEAPVVGHAPLVFSQCRPCHFMPSSDGNENPGATDLPATGCLSGNSPFLVSGSFGDAGAVSPPVAVLAEKPETKDAETSSSPFFWLAGIWILGVVLLSIRFLVSWGFAQRLRSHKNVAVPLLLTQSFKRIAIRVGVRRPVRFLISAAVTVPSVIGWLRPVILLPVASVAGLSRAQLEAVLAHELAHIRRHDFLVNSLQHLVEIILFFHPVVWWVSKKIREEREFCCDDIAAQAAGNTVDYVRALATLEEQRAGQMSLEVAANGGSLQARIRRLCGVEKPRPLLATAFPPVLLLLVSVIPFAMVHSQEPIESKTGAAPVKARKLTSKDAEEGFRHLLKKKPESNILFGDFVMLARALDQKAIPTLLDEIGLKRRDGYWPWARSAIYAELAGRDLGAALDHYRRNYGGYAGVREHVPHAIYVGSRPQDPWDALAYLRGIPDDPRFRLTQKESGINGPMVYTNADWYQLSFQRLFKKLAALDPERAWKELPGQGDGTEEPVNHSKLASHNYAYLDMVDGFFSGLKDSETFQHYFKRLGLVRGPSTEFIAIRVVKAWMNHDLVAAQAWAPPQRGPGIGQGCFLIGGVDGNAALEWARENPRAALEALRANVLPKWKFNFAGAIMRSDPSLASEVVAIVGTSRPPPPPLQKITFQTPDGKVTEELVLPNPAPVKEERPPIIWNVLRGSMAVNSRLQDRDAFPEPGRNNRPLDYRARYDSFRAAIASEVFSQDEQTKLREHLDADFGTVLDLPDPN